MGKTRGVHETTPELRNRMVGMYEAGLGLKEIATAINCSQRTVKRWLNRFDKEGTVETRDRCGRKRATTEEQDQAIIRLATQTPITAAKSVLPALGLSCSVDTIRERLHKAGIHNWSPSRKHMQRIPLGDSDGSTVQQAVWRPTGTQLGKKKVGKQSSKVKKPSNTSTSKKKSATKKAKTKDTYSEDEVVASIATSLKPPEIYNFHPPSLPTVNEIHPDPQSLQSSQSQFSNALNLVPTEQSIYQEADLNIARNWPIDLVQGGHYQHTNQVEREEGAQNLQELHPPEPQSHMHNQVQQHIPHLQDQQQSLHQITQQSAFHQITHEQTNHESIIDPCSTSTTIDICSRRSSDSSMDSNTDSLEATELSAAEKKRTKKGGKAKGTLETSVEIRNRMIGMSEAGLSTMSIALAINRSERTVKRWLERWHKEGNVQTKERKGRRRITTREQDDAIIAMATQNPLTAAKLVAPALGLNCSVDTIRERLHKAGIHSWKLGNKKGEGNAVHTVHLWQPSGNRPNKPKTSGERKKKASNGKKKVSSNSNSNKRGTKKKRAEEEVKITSPPMDVPNEAVMQYHNPPPPCPSIIQPIHGIPTSSELISPPPQMSQNSTAVSQLSQGPHQMSIVGPLIQQRPDCRMAPPIAPQVNLSQSNSSIGYHSCMVGASSHTNHIEATDTLNYEPYIWSF